MAPTPHHSFDPAQRRRGVRRTVFVMAAIALLIYVGFIASGVIGR